MGIFGDGVRSGWEALEATWELASVQSLDLGGRHMSISVYVQMYWAHFILCVLYTVEEHVA